jgi:hypothetical protein
MKQTAVEWLLEELIKGDFEQQQIAIKKAKEMEINQIIKFADEYEEYSANTPDLKQVDTAEEYYYKKNK